MSIKRVTLTSLVCDHCDAEAPTKDTDSWVELRDISFPVTGGRGFEIDDGVDDAMHFCAVHCLTEWLTFTANPSAPPPDPPLPDVWASEKAIIMGGPVSKGRTKPQTIHACDRALYYLLGDYWMATAMCGFSRPMRTPGARETDQSFVDLGSVDDITCLICLDHRDDGRA